MGLEDIYYKQPWDPSAGPRESIQRGLAQFGDIPRQRAEVEGQRLRNEEVRQNLPDNPASPAGRTIFEHIMRSTPGYHPDHEAALKSELQGGPSLAAPGPQGASLGAPGPVGPVIRGGMGGVGGAYQATGFPQAQQPPTSGYGVQMPQPDSAERNYLAGQGPQYAGDQTGMQRPAPVPAPQVQAPPQGQGQGQEQMPISNRDVANAMHMAPFLKMDKEDPRMAIARMQVDQRDRALAERKRAADQADATRRELARLALAYRQNPADKLLLAQLHEAAANHRAAMSDVARMDGGLAAIVSPQEAGTQKEAEHAADLKAMQDYQDALNAAKKAHGGGGGSKSVTVSGPQGAVKKLTGPDSEIQQWLQQNPTWKLTNGP